MRTLSVVLVFVFLAVPSMAGSPDGNLPGLGAFEYIGPPAVHSVPQAILVAFR